MRTGLPALDAELVNISKHPATVLVFTPAGFDASRTVATWAAPSGWTVNAVQIRKGDPVPTTFPTTFPMNVSVVIRVTTDGPFYRATFDKNRFGRVGVSARFYAVGGVWKEVA